MTRALLVSLLAALAVAGTAPAAQVAAVQTQAFKNRPLVVKFVRAKLVYNGFRPSVQFFGADPRIIRFAAIQDGVPFVGTVVKDAKRKITVSVSCNGGIHGICATVYDDALSFVLSFEA